MKKSVEEILTEKVIDAIETGKNLPWQKPWRDSEFIDPKTGRVYPTVFNRSSGRPYNEFNRWILQHDGEYATYRDWKRLFPGCHPRKGESEIVFGWFRGYREEEQEDGSKKKVPSGGLYLKYWNVWHVSAVEGAKPLVLRRLQGGDENLSEVKIDAVEDVLNGYYSREGIVYTEDEEGNAFYIASLDKIHLPKYEYFAETAEYYSTKFHESIHSTGHEKRLNRFAKQSIFSRKKAEYSKEELTAEIGAAILMNRYGIETERTLNNSAAYIRGWIRPLHDNPQWLVSANSKAKKAVEYITGVR